MGLPLLTKLLCVATALFSALAFPVDAAPAASAVDTKGMPARVLFLMRRGYVTEGIDLYRTYAQALGRPDHDLLQNMGLVLLDYGATCDCPETQLLAIFGAGVAAHDRATHVIIEGLCNRNPQIRLAAVNLLAQRQTDTTDELVSRAITSEDALIRLEAVYLLAKKKHRGAVGQAEALMCKLPCLVWPLFAEIFATIGDARSIRQLRRLMNHQEQSVRLAAIFAAADHGRDDLIPQIRQLSTHLDAGQQEACAAALGKLADEGAVERLKEMANSKTAHVSLSANLALFQLGHLEYAKPIQKLASEGHLLAIFTLGQVEGSEDLLAQLCRTDNPQIQLNATFALLQLGDSRCLPFLRRLLINSCQTHLYVRCLSHGKTLTAWKCIPIASLSADSAPFALELSKKMREIALTLALDLPESDFLVLADSIFEQQQNDLVPTLVTLLENLGSDDAISLLQKYQEKIGAPLVRNYCNLALFRLGVEGPYADALKRWVHDQCQVDLIRFRPMVPWELRDPGHEHQLTPEETSRLYLATVETLASRQDDHGTQALLDLIKDGNPKNRYPLAGLLIRAVQ